MRRFNHRCPGNRQSARDAHARLEDAFFLSPHRHPDDAHPRNCRFHHCWQGNRFVADIGACPVHLVSGVAHPAARRHRHGEKPPGRGAYRRAAGG